MAQELPPIFSKANAEEVCPSLLQRTIQAFLSHCPLKLNFEDLSGIRTDVPELSLSPEYCVHTCAFCRHAKGTAISHQDCIRNKLAVNRVARRRQTGFHGQCHLGLTDIVEPLVFHQRCLGVFYFGSVIVEGTEREARRRILTFCRRRKLNPAGYLYHFKTAVRIKAVELPIYQEQLRTLAALTINILEAYGLPLDRYRTEMGPQFVASRRLPILIQGAMRYVHRHYREAIQLSDVAAHLKCHPNYLSRTMSQCLGTGFSEYLLRVRIDHARSLLQSSGYGAGEIAFQVGFSDQSYFGKVFKRKTGLTPKEYQDPQTRIRIEKRADQSEFGPYNFSRITDI